MPDWLLELVKSFGAPGLVIGGLAYAVKKLWDRYDAVQEARLADRDKLLTALNQNTEAQLNNARQTESLKEVIQARRVR